MGHGSFCRGKEKARKEMGKADQPPESKSFDVKNFV
jgi:hypothetical protein